MISVLYCADKSVYKQMGLDCWDKARDARLWPGGNPCIAHPPCRSWGRLRGLAKPEPGEKELALLAVEQVRANGGILEHPEASTLWPVAGLPLPGSRDDYGGFSISVNQSWWGYPAVKRTLLYFVGIDIRSVVVPLSLDAPTHIIGGRNKSRGMRELNKSRNAETVPLLAEWLVSLAETAKV